MLGIGFLPGSHRLVVGGPEGFLAIVDADRGEVLQRLRGHRGAIYNPGVSADGRLLATGIDDNIVRLWSLPDGRPLGARLLFRQLVSDVQLSPDGRWLTVVVSDEYYDKGAAEVWDVRTRRRVRTLARPDRDKPGFLRFSPDGELLVMGYRRGLSQVWSTTTWKPVTRPLAADAGAIVHAAISPDGRTLATGSLEGTVRMWDIETEQAVGAALPGLPAIPVIPYFTADGNPDRQLRDRPRIPLGHPARIAGPPRLPGRRTPPHARAVGAVPARPPLRARLLSIPKRDHVGRPHHTQVIPGRTSAPCRRRLCAQPARSTSTTQAGGAASRHGAALAACGKVARRAEA